VATNADWARAYFEQARADHCAVLELRATSPSTIAMLWQMIFEKYAKAALLRSGASPLEAVRRSHRAASKMLFVLRHQRRPFALLGGAPLWADVLSMVDALETAHPQLAAPHAAQLEYPWEDLRGEIRWPERHLRIARPFGSPRSGLAPRVARFVALLHHHFDALFP
jgi:hypothetical protein